MNDIVIKGMNLLLNNFWITKDKRKEDYYFLKQNMGLIKNFVSKNLGNKIIVHERFIKLEKLPGNTKSIYGIASFEDSFDYTLLFLSLIYLEDKPKNDKFILSDFLETIKNTAITLELTNIPNWDLRMHRKSMLRVLKFLEDTEVLWLLDKNQNKFDDDLGEALYATSGLANYLVPSFDYGIENAKNKNDFLSLEFNLLEDNAEFKRYKVYRHLLYTPAIMGRDLTSSEYEYLKIKHKVIEEEIKNNVGLETEITKNMALCYADESSFLKECFPSSKKISDIILLVNEALLKNLQINNIKENPDESFNIEKRTFISLLEDLRISKKDYFSKEILNLSPSKYLNIVIDYLTKYTFIEEHEDYFIINPSICRFVGISKDNEEKMVQLNLEGDNE